MRYRYIVEAHGHRGWIRESVETSEAAASARVTELRARGYHATRITVEPVDGQARPVPVERDK